MVEILINDEIEVQLEDCVFEYIQKNVKGKTLDKKFENILKSYIKKNKPKNKRFLFF